MWHGPGGCGTGREGVACGPRSRTVRGHRLDRARVLVHQLLGHALWVIWGHEHQVRKLVVCLREHHAHASLVRRRRCLGHRRHLRGGLLGELRAAERGCGGEGGGTAHGARTKVGPPWLRALRRVWRLALGMAMPRRANRGSCRTHVSAVGLLRLVIQARVSVGQGDDHEAADVIGHGARATRTGAAAGGAAGHARNELHSFSHTSVLRREAASLAIGPL